MMRRKVCAAVVAAVAITVAGCSSSGAKTAAPSAAASGGATAACAASKVGAITRCSNFYEANWPVINKNLDTLYQQAKQTDGGNLVIWDWYELSPDVIKAFTTRFPGITVQTRGLTYNLSSAIVSAKATGARNTDVVSGSITSMSAMYDQGFWEKVDWKSFGVPAEFLNIGNPELLPDSTNGSVMQYNSTKTDVPPSLDGLLDPKYKGKVSIQSYNANVFAGYGKAKGKDAMVKLIGDLKTSGTLKVVEDQDAPLSTGDIPIALNQILFNPNDALKVASFEDAPVFAQYSGVNVDAKNKAAAMLWVLWNAYDPDWLAKRMTDPAFATTQVPYAGLPASVFDKATGLAKKNADALLASLSGTGQTETQATRDEWNALIDAADKALNG